MIIWDITSLSVLLLHQCITTHRWPKAYEASELEKCLICGLQCLPWSHSVFLTVSAILYNIIYPNGKRHIAHQRLLYGREGTFVGYALQESHMTLSFDSPVASVFTADICSQFSIQVISQLKHASNMLSFKI